MTQPSQEVRIYGDERRHRELVGLLVRTNLLLSDLLDERQEIALPPFPEIPQPQSLDISGLVEQIAARLPEDRTGEITEAFSETVKQLERLNKKVTGLSVMPSGGSSGHVIVDSGNVALSQPVDVSDRSARQLGQVTFPAGTNMEIANDTGNPIPVSSATLATEVTLAQIVDALVNVENSIHAEVEGITSGTWTTVVSYTPTAATTILGFNADVSALTDMLYRMRVVVGGTIKCSETIGSTANSWIPIQSDVAANTAIEVQVFHDQVAPQTFRATISYGTDA